MPHPIPLAGLKAAWSQPSPPVDPVALAAHFWELPTPMVWLDSSSQGHHLIGHGEQVLQASRLDEVTDILSADPGPWVGWFDYESGAQSVVGGPDVDRGGIAFVRLDQWVVIEADGGTTLCARTPELAFTLPALSSEPALNSEPALDSVTDAVALSGDQMAAITPRDTDAAYLAKIEQCLQHLRAGDAWVLCLTTAMSTGPIDAFASHLRLRQLSPVPRGGLLRIGGTTLSSASMEQFLTVDDGWVTTSPIKGTRARHHDRVTDRALAAELAGSEKERAENLMIVDLCRNDLGKICRPGSIGVPQLMEVHSYATVHQLISTVTGHLRPGLGPMDAVAALFPAGSMTGAPKQRAIEIVAALEGAPRGIYSGCFGWISADRADLGMVIRSVVSTDQGASLGVGGGITVLSDPAEELAEIHLKAEALRRSLVRR